MAECYIEEDAFLSRHEGFSLREQVTYPNGGISRFYDNGTDMVIIDEGICRHQEGEPVFSYMLITDKQNCYIHEFRRVFRFLGYEQQEVDRWLSGDRAGVQADIRINSSDRGEQADVSPLELHFEEQFTNAYGMGALRYLTREYSIMNESGGNYFLDYLIRTQSEMLGVEENGVNYHHPQIIGEARYRAQLEKQNTCALWGIKLFRFSSEDCAFESRVTDDIKQYFGRDTSAFVDNGIVVDRRIELYEHQTITLEEIGRRRKSGIEAFLIVLPTAAGKSKIVEEDIIEFGKERQSFRGLILAPNTGICDDWKDRVEESLPQYADRIDIRTNAYMARHYSEYDPSYYDYIVVDDYEIIGLSQEAA